MNVLIQVILLVIAASTGVAWAHEYVAPLDSAAWYVEPTRISCRLRQEVPHYGQAVFETQSGTPQQFHLTTLRKIPRADVAVMESVAPEWRHPNELRRIALVQGMAGVEPIRVDDNLASVLLDHLQEGMAPVITHSGWQRTHEIRVKVSPVNFQQAYGAYLDCLAQLFPVGFDSVVRSSVLFELDSTVLSPEYVQRLKLVAGYMEADPDVSAIYIDGHTDITGRDGYNWDLSRRRAEAVRDQLIELGVAPDQIIMRYHGERLPIAANSPDSVRGLNRRVTLRLERETL